MALGKGERPGPRVGNRSSRILGGPGGGRSLAIAAVSTIVFFGGLALIVVNSPGWPEVQDKFFYWPEFRESLPDIADAFLLNVKLFLAAEVFILVLALFLAVLRGLPGPTLFPLRLLSAAYTDVFRGIPTILLIYLLGFGVPALAIEGVPRSEFFWGGVGLVLVYSAYVAEVYRAGIESVHPSQEAAARSLGLTRLQALRHVIVPQAVRRVIPPLLNDFIGLQKDTALVGLLGLVEAFKQSQIESAGSFNFTPYLATAALFLLLTIPMTRLTDWLIARNRRRELARP
ncbi:MAG TPA: amino acid ABC transporter permease [Gaiellaceae bacterium]|nr:amino acid ABC transporter permease [Gaiellaceae bacterium]